MKLDIHVACICVNTKDVDSRQIKKGRLAALIPRFESLYSVLKVDDPAFLALKVFFQQGIFVSHVGNFLLQIGERNDHGENTADYGEGLKPRRGAEKPANQADSDNRNPGEGGFSPTG